MRQSSAGGVGALLSGAAFAALAALTAWSVATDADPTGGLAALWLSLIALATCGGAVAVHGALRATGGFGTATARLALGSAVLAVVSSITAWGWLGYGTWLAVAMVLLARHLRDRGLGIAGRPSRWDWGMPAAWLMGPASQVVSLMTGPVGPRGSVPWVYLIGLSLGNLIAAATMVALARWLRSGIVSPAGAAAGVPA